MSTIFPNVKCAYYPPSPSGTLHEDAAAIISILSGILIGGISAG